MAGMCMASRFPAFFLSAALALLVAGPAPAEQASGWSESYNSRSRLVAGTDAGTAALHAGIEIVMAPGWKTYWRHPGDSGGVPPYFDWSASSNLKSAKVLYPAPRRLSDASGDAIGYKGAVIFPVAVEPADPSKPIDLKLSLEFGICREICVPAEAKLELDAAAGSAGAASPALTSSLAKVPRAAATRKAGDPEIISAKADLAGDHPSLRIRASFPSGAAGADLFIEAPEGIYVPLPKRPEAAAGNEVEFVVDLANGVEPQDLKGKQLTLTLVSDTGQAEAVWTVE